MSICPWSVPCVCGQRSPGERVWIHDDFGYVYGYVIEEYGSLLRVQLSRALNVSPEHYMVGSRIDLSTDLMTEVKRRG